MLRKLAIGLIFSTLAVVLLVSGCQPSVGAPGAGPNALAPDKATELTAEAHPFMRLAPLKAVEPTTDVTPFTRVEDVIYGRKDGLALTMDVFKPQRPNGAGIIEIVSGGYLSSHAAISEPIIDTFLKRGYTVFCVVHGSQPRYQVPEIFQDIQRASRFIHLHAREYGVDPKRLGVVGASAGGNLSLLLATAGAKGDPVASDRVERETSRVQAVACFFPPTDFLNYGGPGIEKIKATDFDPRFRPSFDYHEKNPTTSTFDRITDKEKLRAISRGISPIYAVSKETPPTLIMHGDKDTLVPLQQSETMVEKLKAAGVTSELIVKKGGSHGWLGINSDIDKFADWFDRHLNNQAARPLAKPFLMNTVQLTVE